MSIPISVALPKWAFPVAVKISELRYPHFQNRFKNNKIRIFHNNESYKDHVESIMGYLGDIACAIFLGIDPKKILIDMILSTDCLIHRDECDLNFNNCNIDVKIEDYDGWQNKVLNGTIKYGDPYGCRLINKGQWKENGENIDIYVFGAFDYPFSENFKMNNAKNINLIGFIEKKNAAKYPFSSKTPANKILPTPAKIIPNSDLEDMSHLKNVVDCGRNYYEKSSNRNNPACIAIIKELNKIW
jgi:hypothetical protein